MYKPTYKLLLYKVAIFWLKIEYNTADFSSIYYAYYFAYGCQLMSTKLNNVLYLLVLIEL